MQKDTNTGQVLSNIFVNVVIVTLTVCVAAAGIKFIMWLF